MSKPFAIFCVILTATLLLAGCATKAAPQRIDYDMGERVPLGPLTYNVIESVWRSQLGNEFKVRLPQQRFLLITISVTNGGGKDASVPLLTLENQNGDSIRELENGDGVDNWFGILRTVGPAQTQQGKIVFDVPLSSYKLRLTDGGDAATEKYAWVKIPLRMDPEMNVETPTPTGAGVPVK
jgi:hypothetical protein